MERNIAKHPLTHPGRFPPESFLSETSPLAFEAIAAFLDRSAAPPARCRRGKLRFNLMYFAILDSCA